MYRYQRKLFEKEALYIAGPECFYTNGPDMLKAMRVKAESLGFGVTLPNDHPLDMKNPDKTKRADSIFTDLSADMKKTTVIVSDLEAYRGAEPDSGTVYEIGMAYALGLKSYAYTRDKRSLATKNQGAVLKNGMVYDERGWVMPYGQLPFAPCIMGSTKIVEGDFNDCLEILIVDLEEEQKKKGLRRNNGKQEKGESAACVQENKPHIVSKERPVIYLADFERYSGQAEEFFEKRKEACKSYGFDAISPMEQAKGVEKMDTDDPFVWAANMFDNYQQHVRDCDIVLANLNNFRGYELSNDVGFECGMGFELGKKLYGFMDHADKMIHRVPSFGESHGYRDHTGSNVEDFDYPVNLMFGSSMKILDGEFEKILERVAGDYKL